MLLKPQSSLAKNKCHKIFRVEADTQLKVGKKVSPVSLCKSIQRLLIKWTIQPLSYREDYKRGIVVILVSSLTMFYRPRRADLL